MFKKKPNIKPFSPLKSSERRRIADQIITDLAIQVPPDNEVPHGDKVAAVSSRTTLRNALLPDSALSARFTTTTGSTLQPVSGAVYVGSHDGHDQRILWAKVDDRMIPTVYTLWHNPDIIPLLHTPPVAVESLQRGSDLMTPGLAGGPPFPKRAKKGSLVAIASTEAPSVPLAVGVCEIDVSDLRSVQGAKGHAVRIMHWYGDELWAWSPSSKPGREPPEALEGWLEDDSQVEEMTQQAEQLQLDNDGEDGGVSLPVEEAHSDEPPGVQEDGRPSQGSAIVDTVEDRELTTKGKHDLSIYAQELIAAEIDDAFRKAFLYGVRHHMEINKGQPNFGLEFPLSQSFVMANLVQPFLPGYTPAQTASLQIKKSSWKNIKKFVKYLDKQQIVKSKDRDGNEVVILDIDFDDQSVRDFVPYRLPKKDGPSGAASGRGDKATALADPSDISVGQKLKRTELYRPKDKLQAIFSRVEADPRGFYTAAELRNLATSYIEKEQLILPNNKRLVKTNPILLDSLFDGSQQIDKDVLTKGTVPRDVLADRLVHACSPFHIIVRNEDQAAFSKPKSGSPPRITIVLETRSGNKTVTKVSGVEAYHIPPQPLADELRKTCAGSTSVEQLKGSSPKIPVMEIMVQGPQKDAVTKALEKRGVNKQWIEVVDKTKSKKK